MKRSHILISCCLIGIAVIPFAGSALRYRKVTADDRERTSRNLAAGREPAFIDSVQIHSPAPWIQWYKLTFQEPISVDGRDSVRTIFTDPLLNPEHYDIRLPRISSAQYEPPSYNTGGSIFAPDSVLLSNTRCYLVPSKSKRGRRITLSIYVTKKKDSALRPLSKSVTSRRIICEADSLELEDGYYIEYCERYDKLFYEKLHCRWETGVWITHISTNLLSPYQHETAEKYLAQTRNRVFQYYQTMNRIQAQDMTQP